MTRALIVGRCLGFVVLGLAGCAGMPQPEKVVSADQAVQSLFGSKYKILFTNVMNSTASIHVPLTLNTPDGNAGAASCGITFISKHYAITAAHCVYQGDSEIIVENDPLNRSPATTLIVRSYDTTTLQQSSINAQAVVNGNTLATFARGTTLGSTNGYNVTETTCRVAARCGGSTYIERNCPTTTVDGVPADLADMALIHCPNRTATDYDMVISGDVATNTPVEMYWFHEILDLPILPDNTTERWTKYGVYPANDDRGQNWHYRAIQQLLPLDSTQWADGTPYKRVGDATSSNRPSWFDDFYKGDPYVGWTDLFFCHGSSGSGVFERGTTIMLGPLATGSGDNNVWGSKYLCMSPNGVKGGFNAGYTKPEFVSVLQGLPVVTSDR